jgi:hypothetical protein
MNDHSSVRLPSSHHLGYALPTGLVVPSRLMVLMTLAGLPTAIDLSGISFVTTAPAPIVHPLPIFTPGRTMTDPPNQQSSPIWMGLAHSGPEMPLLQTSVNDITRFTVAGPLGGAEVSKAKAVAVHTVPRGRLGELESRFDNRRRTWCGARRRLY